MALRFLPRACFTISCETNSSDKTTIKCYMADTGLLLSHTFDENELASGNIHRRVLCDTIELNEGMLAENAVAQMLTAAGHKLYFFSRNRREDEDGQVRMEIDFLLAGTAIGRRRTRGWPVGLSEKSYSSITPFTASSR